MRNSIYIIPIIIFSFCLQLTEFAFAKETNSPPPARGFADFDRNTIDRILHRAQELPFEERIHYLSSLFVGIPYGSDPLGEGKESAHDKDPLFRLDKVDCITYLEQLLAMLASDNLNRAEANMSLIRYENGIVSYANRRHLTWFQWLPGLEKDGWLEDATDAIGKGVVLHESKTISRKASCSGRWKEFCEKLGNHLPEGRMDRDVLPLTWAIENIERIPDNRLLFVVHTDQAWLPYRIKHAGLVIRDHKKTLQLRHASTVHRKVVDVPLAKYLSMLANKTVKWPVSGLILTRILPRRTSSSFDKREKTPAPTQAN